VSILGGTNNRRCAARYDVAHEGAERKGEMIKKVVKEKYEVHTAGLVGRMYFTPAAFCGGIKGGIELDIDPLRGGWVIPLSEAWQMVIISTVRYFLGNGML
jgi:hypothetical protein